MNEPGDRLEAIDVLRVLVRTTHFIQREFEAQLSSLQLPFPISAPRLRVLSAVSDAKQIRMSELAAKLGIKARTVTDFVDALEQDGLLVRTQDPTDKRATLIELTELAEKHLSGVLAFQSGVSENMLAGLSKEQQKTLTGLLLLLAENKEASGSCADEPE
ncbi:MarR family winged helix-turn-helix transcriptional regulator [Paenibacillus sp. GCM10027627]|uniref:MarR family winged helix-turn-helix transcriptional regulator n=1 Tax=unclassified Paenibacillus TaxID=185978 RepID=UPI00363EAB03